MDPSVDTFRTTTLHMLKHFGVSLDGLELKIESRGAAPLGGGEVVLVVPIIPNSLSVSINHFMEKISLSLSLSTPPYLFSHSNYHIISHIFYSHKYACSLMFYVVSYMDR